MNLEQNKRRNIGIMAMLTLMIAHPLWGHIEQLFFSHLAEPLWHRWALTACLGVALAVSMLRNASPTHIFRLLYISFYLVVGQSFFHLYQLQAVVPYLIDILAYLPAAVMLFPSRRAVNAFYLYCLGWAFVGFFTGMDSQIYYMQMSVMIFAAGFYAFYYMKSTELSVQGEINRSLMTANEELALKTEQLRAAADLVGLGSYIYDLETHAAFYSDILRTILLNLKKMDHHENGDLEWFDFVHKDDINNVRLLWRSMVREGAVFEARFRVVYAVDNQECWLHHQAHVVVSDDGLARRVVGVVRDVTKEEWSKRQIESQQLMLVQAGKMSSLGEMAAGIAHEINNPLLIIKGMMDIMSMRLEKGEFDPRKVKELITRVNKTINRMAKIVGGLKTFSRNAVQEPLEKSSWQTIITDTLDFCESRYKDYGVDLRIKMPGVEREFDCRSVQISQVLLNLLNNAFDVVNSLPNPWVEIEVIYEEQAARLMVTDCGNGISPETETKIFEPFFTTKSAGHGTGLGLSISRNIVVAHGGRLYLDRSVPNTRFVIELPYRNVTSERHAA